MKKKELEKFIEEHRDTIGPVYIAINERFWGQFTLGYYYDQDFNVYKVFEVNERQDVWIRDEYEDESEALERLYKLIKTTFWIK